MPRTANSRKEMIGRLVAHSLATAAAASQQDWLREVFEKGFVGYSKFSDRQLLLELDLHGLTPASALFEEDGDADADMDADSDSLYEPLYN
jgi:hypothetical protein